MENKFTSGPWEISWNTFNKGEAHGIYATGELDLKGLQIATVNIYPTMDADKHERQGRYNALLIAASPELFEIVYNTFMGFAGLTVPIGSKLSVEVDASRINKALGIIKTITADIKP